MKGFYNKLLRIDLTNRIISKEEISDDILKANLGGKGLGGYLLLKEIPLNVKPLSPLGFVYSKSSSIFGPDFKCAMRAIQPVHLQAML